MNAEPSRPLIAVVVPTYQRADGAARMIDALERQTLDRALFEVVLVDDCSPDGSVAEIAERGARSPLHVQVLSTPANAGPAGARNLGWRATRAALLAFVDDDCVPEPRWLEAGLARLVSDERLGVLQGQTRRPEGTKLGDWTLWREITGPTPFFEGCNIFYRREAFEATGGFDEVLGFSPGEDTAAGWAVVDAGWERGYESTAVVEHDVEERGVRWHIHNGFHESNLVGVAARHPGFRREAFWRPWAFRRENAACTVAVFGALAAARWRPALLLALPYVYWRRPPAGHHRRAALMAERLAVDTAQAAGLLVGSVRSRIVVL